MSNAQFPADPAKSSQDFQSVNQINNSENLVQTEIINVIDHSKKILILPSSPPDGDSLGSAIALYMALQKLGKNVTAICSDPVPEVLRFLPNIKMVGNKLVSSNDFIITLNCDQNLKVKEVKSQIEDNKVNIIISPENGEVQENQISFHKGKADYDLIITVDCAELPQLRKLYEENIEMFQEIPIINIDHHTSNEHFGKINHVDIMASSTTEILTPLIEQLASQNDLELIDEDLATLLLTGIITDTGSFQNSNTTPRAFEVASKLVEYGARQQEIIRYIYKTKQLSQLKLWGRILSKIKTDDKHRLVWSTVSQQDFLDTGSNENETGDVIDELLTNAPGAEIVLLLKEKANGEIGGSIRTTNSSVNGAKIAKAFGGGGHIQAAGFRIPDSDLLNVESEVIEKIKAYQAERLGLTDEDEELFDADLIPKKVREEFEEENFDTDENLEQELEEEEKKVPEVELPETQEASENNPFASPQIPQTPQTEQVDPDQHVKQDQQLQQVPQSQQETPFQEPSLNPFDNSNQQNHQNIQADPQRKESIDPNSQNQTPPPPETPPFI